MSMARGRFKTNRKKSSSITMAKRNGRRSKSRRKSSSGTSGVFSGKILGFKIPLISDVLRNKTAQKLIAGAGIVSIITAGAALVNNPMLNRAVSNPIVKLGLAGAAGDVTGVIGQVVTGGGISQLRGIVGQAGNGQQALVPMSGGGVA